MAQLAARSMVLTVSDPRKATLCSAEIVALVVVVVVILFLSQSIVLQIAQYVSENMTNTMGGLF